MLRLTAVALAVAAVAATSSLRGEHKDGHRDDKHYDTHRYGKRVYKTGPHVPTGSIGIYGEKKCHGYPDLVVEAHREWSSCVVAPEA